MKIYLLIITFLLSSMALPSSAQKIKNIFKKKVKYPVPELVIPTNREATLKLYDASNTVLKNIPDSVAKVELFMIDSCAAWQIEGNVMILVNNIEKIHTSYYKYDLLQQFVDNQQVEFTPIFDLTISGGRFREVTGHEMLSVEGMRFVHALLREFTEKTSFKNIVVIAPKGTLRENLITEFSDTPTIIFTDKCL